MELAENYENRRLRNVQPNVTHALIFPKQFITMKGSKGRFNKKKKTNKQIENGVVLKKAIF